MSNFLFGLVFSKKDPVSMNTFRTLREFVSDISSCDEIQKLSSIDYDLFISKELNALLIVTSEDLIYAENVNSFRWYVNRFIFVSRHESSSHLPSLLTHFPGNWLRENPLGGNPEELGVADPIFEKTYFQMLLETVEEFNLDDKYHVSLEATHHGPTSIEKPVTFIEIGSSPQEWNDQKAIKTLIESLIKTLKTLSCSNVKYTKVAVGFGGPHYAPTFTKIVSQTDIAIAHIASRYVIDKATDTILLNALEKSYTKPTMILLDWKGLRKSQRDRLLRIFSNTNLEILKTKALL
ncbi:MAG: D-aminoacyl-tRNA deacylase [Candidatus Njordarchaeales archaeon]